MSTLAVWKFPLEPTVDRDEYGNMIVDVEVPGIDTAPRILTAADQDGTICVWAAVALKEERTTQRFIVVPTGNQVGSWNAYVGTAFHGSLVFHVFHCL